MSTRESSATPEKGVTWKQLFATTLAIVGLLALPLLSSWGDLREKVTRHETVINTVNLPQMSKDVETIKRDVDWIRHSLQARRR